MSPPDPAVAFPPNTLLAWPSRMSAPDRSTWPTWATAPAHIVPPDPTWATLGRTLAADLETRLAPWLGRGVHHVGSTSIPDLAAKPIIDLMADICDLALTPTIAPVLTAAGWHHVNPLPGALSAVVLAGDPRSTALV